MSKNFRKLLFISLFFCYSATMLFSQSRTSSHLTQGETLFMQNKPAEASLALEDEIRKGTASTSAWNYLGLCYYQLENYEKACEVFQKGLSVAGTNKKILAFNAGNAFYAMRNYEKAAEYYSLAYKTDRNYSQAVLNRANAYLMFAAYDKALADYELFLEIAPGDPQEPQIIEMIALLRREIVRLEEERRLAEEEAARLAEEERLMQEELARLQAEREEAERLAREEEERIAAAKRAEEERIAAEKRAEEERIAAEKRAEEERIAEEKRRAEAERRRKLLEDVAKSLQSTDSTNLSSGAEDIIDFDQESELD